MNADGRASIPANSHNELLPLHRFRLRSLRRAASIWGRLLVIGSSSSQIRRLRSICIPVVWQLFELKSQAGLRNKYRLAFVNTFFFASPICVFCNLIYRRFCAPVQWPPRARDRGTNGCSGGSKQFLYKKLISRLRSEKKHPLQASDELHKSVGGSRGD